MSRFEYLSVLVSIVIALGISEMASAWGRLLRERHHVRFYWLQAFWSLFTVLLMIEFWWGFWGFRVVETWTFPGLVAVVAESLVMVLAGMTLLPQVEFGHPVDLKLHYFAQCRLYFTLGAVLLLLLGVVDHLVGEQPLLHAENAIRLSGIGVALLAAASPNERVHTALAAAASVLFTGFVVFAFTR